MIILIVGSESQRKEVSQKFGDRHRYLLAAEADLKSVDVVFDFVVRVGLEKVQMYKGTPSLPVFFDTSMIALSKLTKGLSNVCFGFCGLPSFVNRPVLEVSLGNSGDRQKLETLCKELQTEYEVVEEGIGMVTPRIVCMIINEAFYAVEDGTATREDIDLAMKLGTNYPFGPFEWCDKIGAANVVRLLDAVHQETGDERYLVSAMLRNDSNL